MMNITEDMRIGVNDYLCRHADEDYVLAFLEDVMDIGWVVVYDGLDELFDEYCNGDVEEILNLFVGSRATIDSCQEYYVKDGYAKDADEMSYDLEELFADDDFIDSIIETSMDSNKDYTALVDIYNIVKEHSCDWQDVQDAIAKCEYDYLNAERSRVDDATLDMFVNDICLYVRAAHDIVEYLDKTHFCGIDEECYADICDYYDNTDNAFALMVDEIVIMAIGGISIEKATEMYVKKYWK